MQPVQDVLSWFTYVADSGIEDICHVHSPGH